jgi:hypothetical protein
MLFGGCPVGSRQAAVDTSTVARRSILIPLAAALSVVAAALWLARSDERPRVSAAVTPATGSGPAPAKATARLAGPSDRPAPASTAAPGAADTSPVPPGLSAAQWAALETEWRGRPDGAAERERLMAYFSWQHAARRWRADPSDAALAAEVRAGLPDRLARREVSAGEARQLEVALLLTLEPDPARRAAAVQAFDAAQLAPAPPDVHTLAYRREQAAAVASWQAVPAAQRDPATLKTELDRLRRTHFAQHNPPAAPETSR